MHAPISEIIEDGLLKIIISFLHVHSYYNSVAARWVVRSQYYLANCKSRKLRNRSSYYVQDLALYLIRPHIGFNPYLLSLECYSFGQEDKVPA